MGNLARKIREYDPPVIILGSLFAIYFLFILAVGPFWRKMEKNKEELSRQKTAYFEKIDMNDLSDLMIEDGLGNKEIFFKINTQDSNYYNFEKIKRMKHEELEKRLLKEYMNK